MRAKSGLQLMADAALWRYGLVASESWLDGIAISCSYCVETRDPFFQLQPDNLLLQ